MLASVLALLPTRTYAAEAGTSGASTDISKPILLKFDDTIDASASGPLVFFSDIYRVDFCIPPQAASDARDWTLALSGVSVRKADIYLRKPGDCLLSENPSSKGDRVQLGYKLDYVEADRKKWLLIINQLDHGAVAASWRDGKGEDIAFAREDQATNLIRFSVHHPLKIAALFVLVLLLSLGVWVSDRRRGEHGASMLRDNTCYRKQYLRTQLQAFLDQREQEQAARRELASDLMSHGFEDGWTKVTELLTATDGKVKEELAAKLSKDMRDNHVDNVAAKVEGACTRYDALKRRGKDLRKDLMQSEEDAGIKGQSEAPNVLAEVPDELRSALQGFRLRIEAIRCRPPYSLARCQMAWWTIIIVGSVFLMYLVTGTVFQVPAELLYLLGISVTTAGISYAMDISRPLSKLPPVSRGLWKDITSDAEGQTTLYRWQIVVWTLMLSSLFLAELWRNLIMMQFDPTLLGLMGISSGTYLGFKWPERANTPDATVPG